MKSSFTSCPLAIFELSGGERFFSRSKFLFRQLILFEGSMLVNYEWKDIKFSLDIHILDL